MAYAQQFEIVVFLNNEFGEVSEVAFANNRDELRKAVDAFVRNHWDDYSDECIDAVNDPDDEFWQESGFAWESIVCPGVYIPPRDYE